MDHLFAVLYIGPGLGGGVLATIFGIIISFFLSLIAIFWFPIKKLIRFIRNKITKKSGNYLE